MSAHTAYPTEQDPQAKLAKSAVLAIALVAWFLGSLWLWAYPLFNGGSTSGWRTLFACAGLFLSTVLLNALHAYRANLKAQMEA